MSNLAAAIPLENTSTKGPMGFKEEQKRQRQIVSQALMEGALQLSAEEGYASLSLRSVARKAGIAPTSFYRHFRDMDELGLALVGQAADLFRPEFEKALESMDYALPEKGTKAAKISQALKGVIHPFAKCFFNMVAAHPNLFRLFFQERTGSSRALRDAIAGEFRKAVRALSERMDALEMEFGANQEFRLSLAQAMLNLAVAGAQEMLANEDSTAQAIKKRVSRECTLLLLGALIS